VKVILAALFFFTLLAIPALFDEAGSFRLTADPTPLEVMEDIPGALVLRAPRQVALAREDRETIAHKGYRLTTLDRFEIDAVVLARRNYRFGREADISPMDLVMGWQDMSDPQSLDHIEISQRNRFYFYRTDARSPLNIAEIAFQSANMHMVPHTDEVARKLDAIRPGEIVHLEGMLVNVDALDGWRWRTSRKRSDTGAGACEILLVAAASIRTFEEVEMEDAT
jgi:hypothetical protein